jgi:hypothetical protein
MITRSLRRLTTITALSLATMAAAAACTSAAPVQPLSAGPASPSPSVASPTPATSAATGPKPVQAPATTGHTNPPPSGSSCLGAVVHRIDASDTGPPWKPRCIAVGGVVLVTNLGPEGFSVSSPDKVECNYEGGVRECRLLHPGTVKFTITNAHQTRTLTVVIAKASPSTPPTACKSAFTIDATDGGPAGRPVCVRTSGVVRVINLGPEGFSVSPSGAVSCSYEAAVRQCRFNGPGTVTFTTTHGDSAPRIQKVVAVR